jgi:hypothetical protein
MLYPPYLVELAGNDRQAAKILPLNAIKATFALVPVQK